MRSPPLSAPGSHSAGGVTWLGTISKSRLSTWCLACTRVPPVDEQGGALGQHDGDAGRAGEAGQPGQPLVMRGDRLALIGIGARHEKAVDARPAQRLTERIASRSRLGADPPTMSKLWNIAIAPVTWPPRPLSVAELLRKCKP